MDSTKNMLARVVAHEEFIITEVLDLKHPLVVPTSEHRVGTVILDTEYIGFSEEALALLEKVPPSNDDIGDVDWFKIKAGTEPKHAFAWLGPINRIFSAVGVEGSRNYHVRREACIIIPNEVTEEMLEAIKNNKGAWKDPALV